MRKLKGTHLEFIGKKVEQITQEASFNLRPDVVRLLKRAYQNEANKKAKRALAWIIENAQIAKEKKLAICQDTGMPMVFIEAGKNIEVSSLLVTAIEKAVETAYKRNYLRASIVDPLIRARPSFKGIVTHVELSCRGSGLKIHIFPKGFGSENKSRLGMFNPTVSINEIEDFIIETIKKAGPEACPPFMIGIGIGGTSDKALLLAKKALLTNIDKPNPDKLLNRLEKELLSKINALKIGPMGLGGVHTALAVKIKKQPTHIAGLPVGVNISCWALRSRTLILKNGES